MFLVCPDCHNPFFLGMFFMNMLEYSIKHNHKLKIVCSKCGMQTKARWGGPSEYEEEIDE